MGLSRGWKQQSEEGSAEMLWRVGRGRLSWDPHQAPPTAPQVEEAVGVLQAHQTTEWTKVNVTETRWVAEGVRTGNS